MICRRWRRLAACSDSQLKQAHRILDSVHGVEAAFDEGLRLIWISASVERLTGVKAEHYQQAEDVLELLIHDSDRELCRRRMELLLADGVVQDFELRLRRHDGEVAWVRSHWQILPANKESPRLLRLSAEDIQAWKETESTLLETVTELRQAQGLREHYLMRSTHERQRLSALLDLIRLGIVFVDHDHRVLYSNRAMLEVWGLPREVQIAGMYDQALQEMLAPLLENSEGYFERIAAVVNRRETVSEEREFRLADGRIITERSALVKGTNQRRVLGRLWIYEDVTALRQAAAQLQAMAERDPLTNIFNRRRFHHELERMLADAARRQSAVGLLSLDLDGFKPVNDIFGHQAGDEVLIAVVERLSGIVRRNEMLFRIGGDEFAILTSDARPQALTELAGRLCKELAALSFTFAGETCQITVSIGIAVYPDDAGDASSLITAADQAMYRSKSKGRNCWTLFGSNGESERANPLEWPVMAPHDGAPNKPDTERIDMARMVNCIKLGREAEGLDLPPLPGELGKRVFENVSKEAWQQWISYQTMLINENRLNLMDVRARKYLTEQLEKYFFEGGVDQIAGYVPPAE